MGISSMTNRSSKWMGVWAALALVAAPAAMATVGDDIRSGQGPVVAAQNAKAAGVSATDAVRQLIDAEVAPPAAAQTVAQVWDTCDDTKAAVGAAVGADPQGAGEIVQAVSSLRDCRCSAQGLWSLTRLVQRLRPERRQALVQVAETCACTAAAVESAIVAAPDYADRIVDGAIRSQNRADQVVDSIGRVGDSPGAGWGTGQYHTRDNTMRRQIKVCDGDRVDNDEFDPSEQWDGFGSDSFTGIGNHQLDCSDAPEDLIISEYVEGSGENRMLELYNGTDDKIDLESGNYQLEVYYAASDVPGVTIPLAGEIEPGQTFVVSHANVAAGLRDQSDQLSRGVSFSGPDAVVLRRGTLTADCHCAQSTVGVAVRGSSEGNQQLVSDEIQARYDGEEGGQRGFIVDSVGQVGVEPDPHWGSGNVTTRDNTIRRKWSVCDGDLNILDPYDPRPEWDAAGDPFAGIGIHDSDCVAASQDLFISEYVETEDDANALELYNATGRELDLAEYGYQLELYYDGSTSAGESIPLTGVLGPNETFVISHPDAPAHVRNKANIVSSDLGYDGQDAIVIRRLRAHGIMQCRNEVAAMFEQNLDAWVLAIDPAPPPISGPTSDDPRPYDGGEIASPN